jgi:hypothetical protein
MSLKINQNSPSGATSWRAPPSLPPRLYHAPTHVWPALALAGSFELLMTLVRTGRQPTVRERSGVSVSRQPRIMHHDAPPSLKADPALEQTVLDWCHTGHSQRAIARGLKVDRRKIKRIVDQAA